MNIVAALETELAQLEAEVEADPRLRKIKRIRDLLADYKPTTPAHAPAKENGSAPPRRRRSQANGPSKRDQIKKELDSFLRSNGPSHRKDMLQYLVALGLMGQEKDPLGSLAAYLSEFTDKFESNGLGHWKHKDTIITPGMNWVKSSGQKLAASGP